MSNDLLLRLKQIIKQQSASPAFKQMKGTDKTNFINQIGQKFDYDRISDEEPELAMELFNYMTGIQNGTITESMELFEREISKIITETTATIPTSSPIMRYDDDIVTKTIKDVIADEFEDMTILKIMGDDGGAFYTMVLQLRLDASIGNNLEAKRFQVSQIMGTFRGAFFAKMTELLPIININTASYQFSKNSNKLNFEVTICLSHTNDRDWVSGIYKGKERAELDEASGKRKSIIKAIKLDTAVVAYKGNKIDKKMLETAIKACGRSELEIFVLRYVGIDVPEVTDTITSEDNEDGENKTEDDGGENQG